MSAMSWKCLYVPVGNDSPVEEHERNAKQLAQDEFEGSLRGAQGRGCGRHPRHGGSPPFSSGIHLLK